VAPTRPGQPAYDLYLQPLADAPPGARVRLARRRRAPSGAAITAAALLAGCAAGRAFRRGEERARNSDWDAAVQYYRQAVQADPNRAEYKIALERAMINASHEHLNQAQLAEARGELVSQLLLAEERTRRRIAQALHDDALQRLLSAHQDLVEAAPGRAGVRRAHQTLEGTIQGLRDAVSALHPITLEQGDLETALNAIARQHSGRGGYRYTVRVEEEAAGVEDELVLSLARELLTNVGRHAEATRCAVSVTREGRRIVLEVADDGRGIAAGRQEEALREGHIGLASALQRVRAIGGEAEVSSEPGKGTTVRARIPIEERAGVEQPG
jgi:signal transduction histidine kinase